MSPLLATSSLSARGGSRANTPQRSVSASLAPSATKAPANTRRIQVNTRGRETMWSRTAAGKEPIANEDDERERHEDGTEAEHARQRVWFVAAHELRQERQKEDRELRIEDIDQDGGVDHL